MYENKINLQKISFQPIITLGLKSTSIYMILKINKLRKYGFLLYGLMFFLLNTSCSTKRNTFTSRTYHNVTAYYNVYWNGNESFKDGVNELNKKVKDNYALVLPVFKYGTKQDAQSIYPAMDRAIEKSKKTILKHSMYFKRKEYVKAIDNSYLLIGKASLYKKDYPNAKRTFIYITDRFPKEPIKYEALVWLARTYIQSGEYEKAEAILDQLRKDIVTGKASEKLDKDIALVYADLFVTQGKYSTSIKHLQRSLETFKGKKVRNRLRFILAQIYQEMGDLQASSSLYQFILKKNPSYEMAINAKINLAKTYNSKTGGKSLILRKLNKLIKDSKNKEYLDQIYFAMADVHLKDNESEKAKEYLKLSVASSVSNNYQKAISSLVVAELFFNQPEYDLAQAYYDTAMQFLPENYPNYIDVKSKTETLTELITNLKTVNLQDSLQKLAGMSEAERNAVIDKIIKKIVEEEARKAEEERERQLSLSMLNQNSRNQGFNQNMGNNQQGGGWYFYNTSAISFGYTEFLKKWGRRKLEDNWRLSNKQMVMSEEELAEGEIADSTSADTTKRESDPKKRETYLQDLPLTPEKITESNLLIEDALFDASVIYLDGLKDNEKAIETFEELIKRFPNTKYQLQTYYQLYKIYQQIGYSDQENFYKDLIVNNFPDSDYARLIIDPNYNLVLEAKNNAASNLYQLTYQAFIDNQYFTVINNANEAISKYEDKELLSKFLFLRAVSLGRAVNQDSLITGLTNVVEKYPQSEIKPLAQSILKRLGKDGEIIEDEKKIDDGQPAGSELTSTANYVYNEMATHFYTVVINTLDVNINALKVKISDFNQKFYSQNTLTINNLLLDEKHHLITVGNFENAAAAFDYFESIGTNTYVFSQLSSDQFMDFVISADNYPEFYKDKSADVYQKFFQRNYKGSK